MKKMTNSMWSEKKVRRFVEDTKKREEHAWALLPKLRRALLAETAIGILGNLDRESISPCQVHFLFVDLCAVAGVES